MGICPPERAVQRRGQMGITEETPLPYVLFNLRTGVYDHVGV